MHTSYGKKVLSYFLIFALLFSTVFIDNTAHASANKQIKLNVQKTKTLKVGKSYKLKVKNLPKRASRVKYKWTSSKKKVVSVSKKGRVKAKKPGTTKITCKVSYRMKTGGRTVKKKKRLTCKIRVVQKVTPTLSVPNVTSKPVITSAPNATASPDVTLTPDGTSSPMVTSMPNVTSTPTVLPDITSAPNVTSTPAVPPDITSAPNVTATPAVTPPATPLPSLSEYVKDMGIGINLGNTMDAYWLDTENRTSGAQIIGDNTPADYETCWGAVVTTQKTIDGYKNAGFSTVRIPVYWGNMMEDDGAFVINEEYMKRIEELVGYCLKDNLYVVINIHHYDEFLIKNYEKDEVIRITEKLWTQIAEHFKEYSDHLVFEGFNENLGSQREDDNYTEDEIYDYVNQMNQTFVNAVRKSGGNNMQRVLIVSGYWTNIDKTTDSRFKMPEDTIPDRLMVSVHYVDNSMYWSNNIGGKEWLEYSTGQCELLKKAFTDKGIPVFMGECTSIYEKKRFATDASYTKSSECLRVIMNMLTDYGFLPVLWDTDENAYSRTDCCMKSKSDQEVITEIAKKIKESAP